MKLKIAQVIGLNTDQKAAQVIAESADEENTFLAVLSLACDDAFTKGRQSLSQVSEMYFDSEGSASDKLKATFEEAVKKFSSEGEFSLILASISGKVLYLMHRGEMEVYLKRNNQLSSLLSVGAPDQLISGFLQEGDKLLLSTKSFASLLGEDLSSSMDLSKEVWEEEMVAKVGASGLEDQGLAALSLEIEQPSIPTLSSQDSPQDQIDSSSQIINLGQKAPVLALVGNLLSKIFPKSSSAADEISQRPRINLRKFFPRSGRGKLILAIVLILIVGAGVIWQYVNSREKQQQRAFNQTLQSAKDDFNAAKGLATLNPTEAKSKLDAAKDKVNKALEIKPQDSEAQNFKKQIDDESSSILQQSAVSDFPLFLDLDLIKKNFRASQMSLSAAKLLLLDPTSKTLVVVDLVKKSNQILAGSEQLGEATLASLNGGLVFAYSQDKGVLRVDTGSQKVTTISKKDSDWGEIKDIYGFASNIYLLDVTKNQIWKYLPTSEGYSDKREYLTKGTKLDFSGSLRMQIESSVYVLKSGGEILRFTKGDKDHFGLEGLDKGVKDPKNFFVSSETDNLYLLDSGNSRLLILTKTGGYKSQITGDKFASATDLVVDEKGKKVYLLEGSKIYTADLK